MKAGNLGAYRLIDQIGSGGMGNVYRAETIAPVAGLEAGRVVAVKLIKPELISRQGYFKRFLREAELGIAIDHPNVVRTLDVDAAEWNGELHHFLVMELIEGKSLGEIIEESGCQDEEFVHTVAEGVLSGLQAINDAGAVHRDIKPENILITDDGKVKVTDLGIAHLRVGAARLTQPGQYLGTLLYSAPEQNDGDPGRPDVRTDLYALGLTLFRSLTGVHPFYTGDISAAFRRQLIEKAPAVSTVNHRVTPFFDRFISCLLESSPDRRFANAAVALTVLREGESGAWWSERGGTGTSSAHLDLRGIRKAIAWPLRGNRVLEFLGGLLLITLCLTAAWAIGTLSVPGVIIRAALTTILALYLFRYLDEIVRSTWRSDPQPPIWPAPKRLLPFRRSDFSALLVLALAAAPAVLVAFLNVEYYVVLVAAAAGATLLPAAILRHAGNGGFRAADPIEMVRIITLAGQHYLIVITPVWLGLTLRFLAIGEGVMEPISEMWLVFSVLLSAHLAGLVSRIREPLRSRLVTGPDQAVAV